MQLIISSIIIIDGKLDNCDIYGCDMDARSDHGLSEALGVGDGWETLDILP